MQKKENFKFNPREIQEIYTQVLSPQNHKPYHFVHLRWKTPAEKIIDNSNIPFVGSTHNSSSVVRTHNSSSVDERNVNMLGGAMMESDEASICGHVYRSVSQTFTDRDFIIGFYHMPQRVHWRVPKPLNSSHGDRDAEKLKNNIKGEILKECTRRNGNEKLNGCEVMGAGREVMGLLAFGVMKKLKEFVAAESSDWMLGTTQDAFSCCQDAESCDWNIKKMPKMLPLIVTGDWNIVPNETNFCLLVGDVLRAKNRNKFWCPADVLETHKTLVQPTLYLIDFLFRLSLGSEKCTTLLGSTEQDVHTDVYTRVGSRLLPLRAVYQDFYGLRAVYQDLYTDSTSEHVRNYVTTRTQEFSGALDHMFVNGEEVDGEDGLSTRSRMERMERKRSPTLKIIDVKKMPTVNEMESNNTNGEKGGAWNPDRYDEPSDHMLQKAVFEIT